MKFNEFLYTLRKEKGMTQSEVAERLNVTNKAVSKWETGETFPETTQLIPLSNIFDVTVDELLRGERNPIASTEQTETHDEKKEEPTEEPFTPKPPVIDHPAQTKKAEEWTHKEYAEAMRTPWKKVDLIVFIVGLVISFIVVPIIGNALKSPHIVTYILQAIAYPAWIVAMGKHFSKPLYFRPTYAFISYCIIAVGACLLFIMGGIYVAHSTPDEIPSDIFVLSIFLLISLGIIVWGVVRLFKAKYKFTYRTFFRVKK